MARAVRRERVRWLSADEQAAWRNFQRMQFHLTARLNRQLSSESGLSLQDYMVLVVLTERPDGRVRPFELGRDLAWEKSRVSHHLSRMADRGLVRRERCETDQRGAFVAVTEQGRAAIEAAAPGHVAAVRRWFVDLLTPEQVRALGEIGETVLAALEPACDEDGGP